MGLQPFTAPVVDLRPGPAPRAPAMSRSATGWPRTAPFTGVHPVPGVPAGALRSTPVRPGRPHPYTTPIATVEGRLRLPSRALPGTPGGRPALPSHHLFVGA